jgi:hypothetical protein
MKLALVINSCYKYHKTTINLLICSAKLAKIPGENIYVVVGESEVETDLIYNGDYNIIFCKYVNIDFNAAIYFTQTKKGRKEISKYTHMFYCHDSTEFKDWFWENINNNYLMRCCDYIKLENILTKNIGLFNVKWFLINKTELLRHFINYDIKLVLNYKEGNFPNKLFIKNIFINIGELLCEDSLFVFDDNHKPLGKVFKNNFKEIFFVRKYSDSERRATVYNEPGIIKYQKNWGQSKRWDITL